MPLDQLLERSAGGVDEQAAGLDDAAAEHEALGIDDTGQVGEAEADPPAHFFDDAASRRVTGFGGSRDVLAAHALGIAAGHAHDLAESSGQGGLAGPDAQSRAGGEALPAAVAPAGTGWAVGVDDHVPDFAGEARRAHLDAVVHHDAAADARAERDHHDVVEAAGGTQAMLGQDGEVGVVLDDDPPPGEAVADQGGPVHAVRLRQVGREAQPAVAVDHARRTDADRCRIRAGSEAVVELSGDQRDGLGDMAPHDLPRAGRGGNARLAHHLVAGSQRDAEDLGATDVDPERHAGTVVPGRAGAHDVDSTRAFSSRMAVAMMRLVARILMNPGIGTRNSASRWYVTSVVLPSPASKT